MFLKQKRKTVWLVLVILLAVIVATSGCGDKTTDVTGDVVAQVNGDEITRADLDAFIDIYSLLMPDLDQMLAEESLRPMIEAQLLDAMVENVVVEQAVKELGITVTDEEMRIAYEEVKLQMISGMMFASEDDYNQALQDKNINEDDLIKFLGGNVYYDKMEEHFTVQVTEEKITDFITENPDFLKTPAIMELSHILFESEEDALAGYERALAGDNFGELAWELSLDPTAKDESHPGYLGYLGDDIPENEPGLVAEFMAGANAIENDGDISEPVETEFGWHLIKLHKRVLGEELSGEEARAAASDALIWEGISTFINTFYEESDIELLLT
jgi:foldase protein PrsA